MSAGERVTAAGQDRVRPPLSDGIAARPMAIVLDEQAATDASARALETEAFGNQVDRVLRK